MFNGDDLSGWHPRQTDRPVSWKVVDGMMANAPAEGHHGTCFVSDQTFWNFEVYMEYRVPKNSNSGLYLRGLYEVQIRDSFGAKPDPGINGGIWATAAPTRNASKPAGEWQSIYVRIVGKTVETVVLNGETVHTNVDVPRPTGGNLKLSVDEPGPVMIQGDHGAIDVRCVVVRPIKSCRSKCGQ